MATDPMMGSQNKNLLIFATLLKIFKFIFVGNYDANNMFVFIKNYDPQSIVHFLGALFTLMLGSIPQQDIFQRVTSAKSADTAKRGMLLGACLYLIFCLMPIFLVFSATIIDGDLVAKFINEDSEMILPTLILSYTPLFVQVLFSYYRSNICFN